MANDVVLITNADSDAGYRTARELIDDGNRVVVTARHAAALTRILLGTNANQVTAVAADLRDPHQWAELLRRSQARFGPITRVVDGRTGAAMHSLGDREAA